MASKKKAAKPAKKTTIKKPVKPAAKKAAPAKKVAPKSIKKTMPKKTAPKPVAKKAAPAKKAPVAKHPVAVKKPAVPVNVKAPVAVAKHPVAKTEVKKVEQKHEVKAAPAPIAKQEVKKPVIPAKPSKVVIPELKTKTVRKYEPEFTKSVLDTFQHENTGPTMRYSDAELSEFKDLIMKKLDAAKKELNYLQGLITRKDEMGGDDTDNRYMTMEDGSMSMEREQLSQMASRQITFIDHLEKALMRIENKTYGICRVTGKLIDKARLKAVPHATLSIEAKQTMNK
ncbi:MAG: TraR/DksA family transcriptional regulator [Bacteroidetes bacterium]|nr:TraR/DksA family transcriptional regulator [Bacteroidota bacterium]